MFCPYHTLSSLSFCRLAINKVEGLVSLNRSSKINYLSIKKWSKFKSIINFSPYCSSRMNPVDFFLLLRWAFGPRFLLSHPGDVFQLKSSHDWPPSYPFCSWLFSVRILPKLKKHNPLNVTQNTWEKAINIYLKICSKMFLSCPF